MRTVTRLLAMCALTGVVLGGAVILLTAGLFSFFPLHLPDRLQASVAVCGELLLVLGYASSVLWFTASSHGLKRLSWAAPLGRMAFTTYVVQSLVFSAIFFGWGLGAYGMRPTPALLVGVVVYFLQVWASKVWLRRYRFGPMEWFWRTLTYASPQPMRRPLADVMVHGGLAPFDKQA